MPNHFGHPGTDVDFRKFAAPFDTADAFHDFCWITDYNDQNMVENVSGERARLLMGLADGGSVGLETTAWRWRM